MPVRLLVSVRDRFEAVAAVGGGADIVDVKEPNQGALGFAGADTIGEVLQVVNGSVPVSAALGECVEWLDQEAVIPMQAGTQRARLCSRLHGDDDLAGGVTLQESKANAFDLQGLTYAKMGPAGLLNHDCGRAWPDAWFRARESFGREFSSNAATTVSGPEWVAVAYADFQAARSPAPNDILDTAIETGCAGFLIDTFTKGNGSTFDLLSESDLVALKRKANDAGMFFALAGQITDNHLPAVRRIRPDIVAIRGAVCEGNDRRATICKQRLAALKKALLEI